MRDWIDVKDAVPAKPNPEVEVSEEVLVYSPKYPSQKMGRYRHYSQTWTFSGSNSDYTEFITHWMPYPEPPTV